MHGKSNPLSERLTAFSHTCSELGGQIPSLALRKLFEKNGESYHSWNASLLGNVSSHPGLGESFQSSEDLHQKYRRTVELRDNARTTMIALQEEMDWLVYAAYNFLPVESPAVGDVNTSALPAPLQREQRPFYLWTEAGGDYEKAVDLIPTNWSAERQALWIARFSAIRDNEHIRRVEQAVHKRRWDEQWKVGNRWTCGPIAYAAEFIDAFTWWLAEKAEWFLEHKAKGGPIESDNGPPRFGKTSASKLHGRSLSKLSHRSTLTKPPRTVTSQGLIIHILLSSVSSASFSKTKPFRKECRMPSVGIS